MEYQLTSSNEIIARVIRDFRVNNINWKASAYDWIADAMLAINAWYSFKTIEKDVKIESHKAHYPCNLIELIGVKHNGHKLPLGKNIAKVHSRRLFNREDVRMDITNYEKVWEVNAKIIELANLQQIYDAEHNPEDLDRIVELTKQIANYTIPYAAFPYNKYGFHYYNLQPGCIETTFEEGCITLIYTGSVSDENDLPLVPNVFEFKEAIAWFIMSRLLLGGYEHPVLNYEKADAKWEFFKLAARNKIKMPSIDRMQALANMWTQPVFDRHLPDRFFEGAEDIMNITGDGIYNIRKYNTIL